MKKFIFILFSLIFLFSGCSYYGEKKEFNSKLVVTGFVDGKKDVEENGTYYSGPLKGEKIYSYYVTVIDSCGNKTTYETEYDIYNSLSKNEAVRVYTTKNKKIFSIKKYVNNYEQEKSEVR